MDNLFYSLQAEQAVLGGLLLDNFAWERVHDKLSEGDFYHYSHQLIFAALIEELHSGRNCDILMLSEKLKLQDKLESVGGETYLFELAKSTAGTTNICSYAEVIKSRAQQRKIYEIGEDLINNANSIELDRVIASAQQRLIAAQKIFEPEQLTAYNLSEFLSKEIKVRNLLLSPWLPEQGLAMIYAKRGVGKTFVGLNIAYAVASGGEYLGWKAEKPARVLYIDGEMPASTMQERLAGIVQVHEQEANFFQILTPDMQKHGMPDLSTLAGQKMIERFIEGVDLIVVDNISTLCRKIKENEAEGWLPVQEWALRMRTLGKSVIFIHHAGKNGNQRGTSRREDILDTVIVLKHPSDYNPTEGVKFEIHFEKSRGFTGKDAEPLLANLITDQFGKQQWTVETVEKSTYQQVISLFQEGLKPTEIAEELSINKSTVSRHLNKAKVEGLLNAEC